MESSTVVPAFEPGKQVYLPDGRKAIYVEQNGEQHYVRLLFEDPGDGWSEPPWAVADEKITVSPKVYADEPTGIYGERAAAAHAELANVLEDIKAKREELRALEESRREIEAAAEKCPDIQRALDFFAGRITHVVTCGPYGGAPEIKTLDKALEYSESGRPRGLNLLCLFGETGDGKARWAISQYPDGSGWWATVTPYHSEEDAREAIRAQVAKELATWRQDHTKPNNVLRTTFEKNPWLEAPDDWTAALNKQAEENRLKKIANLREQLAELEGGG